MLLPVDHPTTTVWIDESGLVARDRFFVLGAMRTTAAPALGRAVQRYRDRHHWYGELHFARMTTATEPHHAAMVKLLAKAGATGDMTFTCCVADRQAFDVIAQHGGPYEAYEAVATRLLVDAIHDDELVSAVADNYSSPDGANFEENVRSAVNRAHGRLALVSLLRMDSRASDLLQLADLLTSLVGFEYRVAAGLASTTSKKGQFVAWARAQFQCSAVRRGEHTVRSRARVYSSALGPAGALTKNRTRVSLLTERVRTSGL
ncbi:hypothetical protein TR74_18390 [Carbonactinospora thermoautotrophica]|uniref:DUF3800 domain-containing protein n=1 Tax=Carbonactinospora thermoautotrophica TaxID=1469144 RepID=A0A132NBS4_9ACTN|nr:hypothetical protein TR74_18390 [Carbonactinospora thermoautotrophica]